LDFWIENLPLHPNIQSGVEPPHSKKEETTASTCLA
jgi:hypothetical protein